MKKVLIISTCLLINLSFIFDINAYNARSGKGPTPGVLINRRNSVAHAVHVARLNSIENKEETFATLYDDEKFNEKYIYSKPHKESHEKNQNFSSEHSLLWGAVLESLSPIPIAFIQNGLHIETEWFTKHRSSISENKIKKNTPTNIIKYKIVVDIHTKESDQRPELELKVFKNISNNNTTFNKQQSSNSYHVSSQNESTAITTRDTYMEDRLKSNIYTILKSTGQH